MLPAGSRCTFWPLAMAACFAATALPQTALIPGRPFAPRWVGRPPADACVGLTRLATGEIRYYNYNEHAESPDPLYLFSRDGGLTWAKQLLPQGAIAADSPSPLSGEYLRLTNTRAGMVAIRSRGGLDGKWETIPVSAEPCGGFRPAVFIRGGRRVLVPCQSRLMAGVMYSDDDGRTWKRSTLVSAPPHQPGGPHRSARWQNGAVEPTVIELADGRVWMLARTSQDYLYESFSKDGGQTWLPSRPSRFPCTLTMPALGRLRDGRIILVWNNTLPLPEVERDERHKFFVGWGAIEGTWEDVFTNRDALHAAVSSDEGLTWRGFRELFLNPRRNDQDYAHAETTSTHDDRGVHQNQFVQNDDGTLVVALGQHHLHRSLIVFHPDWLLEMTRSNRFANGLEDWSVHQYIAGIRGHCGFNRKAGADLIDHPAGGGRKALRVRRPVDPSLVTENQGAVWNFPAGAAGTFSTRVLMRARSQGARISLLDRWVNPTDLTASAYALCNLELGGASGLKLDADRWYDLRLEWSGTNSPCRLFVDGRPHPEPLPVGRPAPNGVSYVHFLSTATSPDPAGFLVESVEARLP